MKYCLQRHSDKLTAQAFGLDHATVRKWAACYMPHGKEGINRRSGMTVYPIDFKLNAVRMVIHQGLSQKETYVCLNLTADSVFTQWLRRYRKYGTDGLKANPKGRKSVKKLKHAQTIPKADHLKTKEELMKELLCFMLLERSSTFFR